VIIGESFLSKGVRESDLEAKIVADSCLAMRQRARTKGQKPPAEKGTADDSFSRKKLGALAE
jgi:hypothetical protein